jgi:hypothetical protein
MSGPERNLAPRKARPQFQIPLSYLCCLLFKISSFPSVTLRFLLWGRGSKNNLKTYFAIRAAWAIDIGINHIFHINNNF